MSLLTVNSCCTFGLKTGAILISLINFLLNILLLYRVHLIYHNVFSNTNLFIVISIVLSVAYHSTWVYAISEKKAKLLKPLLNLSFIGTLFIAYSPFIVMGYLNSNHVPPLKAVTVFIFVCIFAGLEFYFWFVQYSLYNKFKNQTIESFPEVQQDLVRIPQAPDFVRLPQPKIYKPSCYADDSGPSRICVEPMIEPSAPDYSDVFHQHSNMVYFIPELKSDCGDFESCRIQLDHINSDANVNSDLNDDTRAAGRQIECNEPIRDNYPSETCAVNEFQPVCYESTTQYDESSSQTCETSQCYESNSGCYEPD